MGIMSVWSIPIFKKKNKNKQTNKKKTKNKKQKQNKTKQKKQNKTKTKTKIKNKKKHMFSYFLLLMSILSVWSIPIFVKTKFYFPVNLNFVIF